MPLGHYIVNIWGKRTIFLSIDITFVYEFADIFRASQKLSMRMSKEVAVHADYEPNSLFYFWLLNASIFSGSYDSYPLYIHTFVF